MPVSFRFMLIGFFLVLFGLFGGCREISMYISGKTAKATIYDSYQNKGKHGRRLNSKTIKYQWKGEDGKTVKGYDSVSLDFNPPGNNVEVRYIPGSDTGTGAVVSRLKSNSGTGPFIVFVVGLVIMVAAAYPAFKAAQEYND